ncbi:DUF397 domain-containing protein [Lentzea sp. NEAU-D7]|uniref:DUF397 domain-containing protein n=1 Tax=Lentzea sp. NEAU-D7 TaxID=2994667 RepID=UPI00224B36BF|nr:DUF397 domain-containing protein [Lentzea sp. NEAU-D7]MCX2954472.1 DUF397 domain-containing protein [Lentzea sp. NEAU-D7]
MTNPEKTWRKSSYTAPDNNCVELAVGEAETAVRDSKDPAGISVTITAHVWTCFLAHAKSDGFKP